MSEIKRYSCFGSNEREYGAYVKYLDYIVLEAENAALKKRLEDAIEIASYFAGILEPPDPHTEDEPCEDCKMQRRLQAIKEGK